MVNSNKVYHLSAPQTSQSDKIISNDYGNLALWNMYIWGNGKPTHFAACISSNLNTHTCIWYLQSQRRLFQIHFTGESAGGRLNKKDGLTRYGDSHVKDKTS